MTTVHTVPIGDLIEHSAPPDITTGPGAWLSVQELPGDNLDDCPCGPTTEPVAAEDGSMGWLITHHSLDGRELSEV